MDKKSILGIQVTGTNYEICTKAIVSWAEELSVRNIYAANAHMLVEAYDSPEFRDIVNSADIVTPDGMPLVWALRLKGFPDQERVYGPTLMLKVLEEASKEQIPVGFYGAKPDVLESLVERMKGRFPDLPVVYSYSPPFQEMTAEEDAEVCSIIQGSGVRILFVGLGCPKQERWIADHFGKINTVMIGVGAAFDFHSGTIRQAPSWIQKMGLEWFFRMTQEPNRLWKRYLFTNPRFMFLLIRELMMEKMG